MRVALVCPYDWARPGGVRQHVACLAAELAKDHDVRVFAPASAPPAQAPPAPPSAPAAAPQSAPPASAPPGQPPPAPPSAPAAAPQSAPPASAPPGQPPPAPPPAGPSVEPWVEVIGRPVGVPFNRSIAPIAPSPAAARRLLRRLGAYDADVVHVHEPLAPLISTAATALAPRPVVGTFHAWSDRARLYRAISPLARRAAARLDARIAVSAAARDFAAGALRLPLGAFKIVPNGVDVERFSAAEALPELVDRARPLLLFVGRLEPRKGLDVLVRAYLRVRSSRPEVRLCVVGEGRERERCQQMVPPSIRPDVLFVGSVSHDDLPRYHASADLFVSPATGGESFGIVLLEAMAAGLPVVASDIPGYRTVLRDGRQGRVVPPGDALALAETIATLLANERLRGAMAEQARLTARDYDWPVVACRLVEVYRSAVRRHAR